MSIIQTKSESEFNSSLTTDNKKTNSNSTLDVTDYKKRNFFSSAMFELKQVEWPTFKHVLYWSFMVVCFTAIFSSILGVTDHTFESGRKFVDCTSSKGKGRDLPTCSTELLKNIFSVSN